MTAAVIVRAGTVDDVPQLAAVHVASWRQTYRGLMRDEVLDAPDLLVRRERFWTAALTDERYRDNAVAVAESDGSLVGIAMSGPPLDDGVRWDRQLYVLYTLPTMHGHGVGARLLDAVTDRAPVTGLWVADPNPRAQAFYRKHGFRLDGGRRAEHGVTELRMVRAGSPNETRASAVSIS